MSTEDKLAEPLQAVIEDFRAICDVLGKFDHKFDHVEMAAAVLTLAATLSRLGWHGLPVKDVGRE